MIFGFLIIVMISSCTNDKTLPENISFYHWKSKAEFNKSYQQALNITQTNKIYLHYFDVATLQEPIEGKTLQEPIKGNGGVFPTYVLKSVSQEYQKFEIVPVVFITNRVFKSRELDIEDLSNKIEKLINQISEDQFGKVIKQIQIDCDWTVSTRGKYFELLKQLQNNFEIDVTIRLHQIKYRKKSGIPPVKTGTLMLYNVGDLKNKKQNSTLESSIVKQYITAKTAYPISLNIGLPLFSQTVITNNDNKVKIIKNTERNALENDDHFKIIDNMNLMVVKDTLYKGFFLSKGYNLKFEEMNETIITESFNIIKKSNLNINEIILFHLDEKSLSNINLKELIEKL